MALKKCKECAHEVSSKLLSALSVVLQSNQEED